MSILIKGMKMPESCSMCQFSDVYAYPPDYDDEYVCELKYISMRYEDAQMRHIDCPIIEVPEHGDLIDREPFIEFIEKNWDSYDQWFIGQLEARPIVIPADKGGDA